MILVDTSVWIDVLRDRKGKVVEAFRKIIGDDLYVLARFTQLELLQGAKDDYEWRKLEEYLETQIYLEATERTWVEAARIYYDLRRKGITVNSPIDCCIAQLAIENGVTLLHRDQDFEKIEKIRPLKALRFA
ncbi:MAG: PIN domain nuclease [Aquificota bacterium]|nr:MAG: PIN domain nuclease [Aquificota bacterium]